MRPPRHRPPRPDALVARLPVPLRRAAYRAAHRALTLWWRFARPHTVGVKCVIRDGDRVLLVRHTYGDRDCWELPGGGLRRGEAPEAGARREAREELGLEPAAWISLGTAVLHDHKTTTLHAFQAAWDGTPPAADPGEIAELRWVPAADPPRPRGRDVSELLSRRR